MKHWNDYPVPAMRQEALFGDRVVSCFAGRPQSFYVMFERSLAARPQAQAMVRGEQRWTYAHCEATSARLAAGLQTHGIAAGDRVVMFIDNCTEFVFVLLALQWLGAVAVSVGVREQRPGLAYIARQCGAVAIVAVSSLAERIPEGPKAHALKLRVSVGPALGPGWLAMDSFPPAANGAGQGPRGSRWGNNSMTA